ncbi:hypothetical protein [Luteolibacter sp. LG18]|uniref:hypothetical protein n=1 Tax=Luteolibacter sp. LG18 TaxID=2819286 RepID=UPI002B307CA1|nr:hypothetical protein llg_09660 [Luteolibacter sp. LG18]
MKRSDSPNEGVRFRAQVRHYHRSNARQEVSWNEWVGHDGNGKVGKLWAKIVILGAVMVAVVAIILGFSHGGVI